MGSDRDRRCHRGSKPEQIPPSRFRIHAVAANQSFLGTKRPARTARGFDLYLSRGGRLRWAILCAARLASEPAGSRTGAGCRHSFDASSAYLGFMGRRASRHGRRRARPARLRLAQCDLLDRAWGRAAAAFSSAQSGESHRLDRTDVFRRRGHQCGLRAHRFTGLVAAGDRYVSAATRSFEIYRGSVRRRLPHPRDIGSASPTGPSSWCPSRCGFST